MTARMPGSAPGACHTPSSGVAAPAASCFYLKCSYFIHHEFVGIDIYLLKYYNKILFILMAEGIFFESSQILCSLTSPSSGM